MELTFDVIGKQNISFGASFIGFELAPLNEITSFYRHGLDVITSFSFLNVDSTVDILIKRPWRRYIPILNHYRFKKLRKLF